MILWTIKQLIALRKALVGRAKPSELAWGLAIGLAIGLIPKGNLISVLLIGLAVSLRINHGMVALSAVGFSFLAVRFDPLTHQLGAGILQSPQTRQWLDRWWDAPLVPWTDLNNTVVMGSTIVAGMALLPTFLISLPIFRYFAPRPASEAPQEDPPPASEGCAAATVSQRDVPAVALERTAESHAVAADSEATVADSHPMPAAEEGETQIDIIRMEHPLADDDASRADDKPSNMNEALGYLVRRLKNSRQEKVA
jgi:uncharacterized protein (TIGR03546 family)